MSKALLIVTLGDPLSINIEAIKRLKERIFQDKYITLLVGSRNQINFQAPNLLSELNVRSLSHIEDIQNVISGRYLINVDPEDGSQGHPAKMTDRERGELATKALMALKKISWQGKLAVLTCPIDKKSANSSGFHYPGQTEYFSEIWGGEALMVLSGPRLRVGLVTNHLPLSEVSSHLSIQLVTRKICAFHEFLKTQVKDRKPKIAVTGLNPHASDRGLFGDEEERVILPAIEYCQSDHSYLLEGPIPADTSFFAAYHGKYDGVLAMYHDQGLGPLKTVHFYDAVNISSGLKHLRVSPDHGPAQDLFLKNTANLKSFMEAIEICKRYLDSP